MRQHHFITGRTGYYVEILGSLFIQVSEDGLPEKLERYYEATEEKVLGKAIVDPKINPNQFRYIIYDCMRYEHLLELLEKE